MARLSPIKSKQRDGLWLWLQDRRRQRANLSPSESLVSGLVQFYIPQAGVTHLKSLGETESVPSDPFVGIDTPFDEPGLGVYASGQSVRYEIFPYREGTQRIYAGLLFMWNLGVIEDDAAMSWPEWEFTPGWVTGYSILRFIDGAYEGFRDVSAVTMFSGWLDTGAGWSAPSQFPRTFANPPVTAKVIWSQQEWTQRPTNIPTVLSPFGGVAFDSTFGDKLLRMMSDDLIRSLDGTLAHWVSPADGSGGVLSTVRGSIQGKFLGTYGTAGAEFNFGDSNEVNINDHEFGDWYLVVMRNDTLTESFLIDLFRQRDSAHFSAAVSNTGPYAALSPLDDYYAEGLWSLLSIGDSAHWAVHGYGYFDRIGVWNRALDEDELLALFNSGLGWLPN